jgi:hypothetical protein
VCGAMEVRRVLIVGGAQAGTSAVWLAWADVDWRELLSLVAKLVGKRAIAQGFPPAMGFRLITPNHLRGE